MKITRFASMLPVALGAGFLMGRIGVKNAVNDSNPEQRNTRETRSAIRSPRTDPFGGASFSLSSMADVRELFKNQGGTVASARLTLSTRSLTAEQIPALMEMVQQDARDNPGDYDEGRYTLMNCLFERWAVVDPAAAIGFIKSCKQRSFQQAAAGTCFGAIARVNPGLAMKELEGLPKGELRSQASLAVVMELGKQDPAAALDLMQREPQRSGFSTYYTSSIFATWAKTDPVAAAARLAAMPPASVDQRSASSLAAVWAQKDPEAALKWAKTLKGDWKSAAAIEVYQAMSRDDPAAAWKRLQGEPGYLRGKLMGGVLATVSDEDPEKAAAMLKGLDNKSDRRIAAEQLLNEFTWNDTRLGFDIIDQLGDPAIRRENLGNLLQYAAWGSPALLNEQIAKLSAREKIETAGSVMEGLVRNDPAAAEKYFLALPEAQRSAYSLLNLMEGYSHKDPQKAFDFALSLENPQEQSAAVKGLFSNWSREDPEAAAVGWKRLPEGQSRLEALGSVVDSWAASDPTAAKEWADGLSGSEKARALAAVLPALAKDNPAAAGSQLASLIASPPDGMETNLASSAGQLAGQWAADNPSQAASWAAALPAGQSRDAGLKAVSQSWSQYDAVAAAKWVGSLEAGSSRDAAILPLLDQIRMADPDTAFTWAASISDDNQRLNQLRETLSSWRSSDLNAARAVFGAADLSDKERASLAKELE